MSSLSHPQRAFLVLQNGAVFHGFSFGHPSIALGEVCFNTSMSGYQEILTDPSYHRQLITMTYPMIGNYGTSEFENESLTNQAAGLIVKEYVRRPSCMPTHSLTLGQFLQKNKIPAMEGIDTRRLVRMLRQEGSQNGAIFPEEKLKDFIDPAQVEEVFRFEDIEKSPLFHKLKASMLEKVLSLPSMAGLDLASEVSTTTPYYFGTPQEGRFRIAVLDFGVKLSILNLLQKSGFSVKVFPAKTSYQELQSENFDCYFLSNGPGDPAPLNYVLPTLQKLLSEGKPIFGICLGHQLLGLATGCKTYKLKFGHRGANQPVLRQIDKKIEITSQNHGFAVRVEEKSDIELSHINLNDNTIEGFYSERPPLLSIQYHPEASPGPHDSRFLFHDFFTMVDRHYQASPSKSLEKKA